MQNGKEHSVSDHDPITTNFYAIAQWYIAGKLTVGASLVSTESKNIVLNLFYCPFSPLYNINSPLASETWVN